MLHRQRYFHVAWCNASSRACAPFYTGAGAGIVVRGTFVLEVGARSESKQKLWTTEFDDFDL